MHATAIQIPPESRAAHRANSPAAEHLLEYLMEHPEQAARLEGLHDVLPKWMFTYHFTPLTWPTLADAARVRELERAAVGVCALLKSIPAVVFDGDLQAIADFYGYPDPGYLEMLFEVPNPMDSTVARCDFIDTAQGFMCCEVNLAANIGGWQHGFWEDTYMNHPVLAEFAAREGIVPRWRHPLRVFVEHLVRDAVETGVADGGELNVLAYSADEFTEEHERLGREVYARLLRESGSGLTGELWISLTPQDEVAFRDGALYRGDRRVHAFLEYAAEPLPTQVLRAQLAGAVRVYNGGLTPLLVDKRNLALLSENEELEYWEPEERALIRAHIPWTRLVSARTTTFRGETVRFPEFLLERREEMVLKLGTGKGGDDVHVGRFVDPAAWEQRVRDAVEHGGWIVQEYVESRPYLYPPEPGAAPVPHSVIWGLFCAGSSYAGTWLRMLPTGAGDGVINSGRGAAEGAVLEI